MEFPILQAMPLPPPAIRLVTRFLQPGTHPTALLIKALTFERHDAQESEDDEEFGHEHRHHACLVVSGAGVRIKDLSTPFPHTYVVRHKYTAFNPRWAAWDMTYTLGFSYDEHTGELNPEVDIEDTLIDDDDFGRPEFIHSLTPWG